jgi:2-hydroxychromene-2-carboxylate isomerase
VQFWFDLASTYSYVAALRIEQACARGQYMWRDLERLCAKHGLPWRRPSVFPRNSVLAARVACCAGDAVAPLVRAIFKANFGEDQDISKPETISALVDSIGGDGKQALELAATPDIKAQLRANTGEAQRMGVFGAPNFVVRRELFFGQDRLEDAIGWSLRP